MIREGLQNKYTVLSQHNNSIANTERDASMLAVLRKILTGFLQKTQLAVAKRNLLEAIDLFGQIV